MFMRIILKAWHFLAKENGHFDFLSICANELSSAKTAVMNFLLLRVISCRLVVQMSVTC